MKLRQLSAAILLTIGLLCPQLTLAQTKSPSAPGAGKNKAGQEEETDLSFKERIAVKVNALEWALAVPNVGFEFDLTKSAHNTNTIGANFRYCGGVISQTFFPSFDCSLLDARVEFRHYWHPSKVMKPGQKRKPKYWRAFYWGIYAAYSDYTIYVPNGYDGRGVTAGLTIGYQNNLIKFKRGALDLDLGINVGAMFGDYEKSKVVNEERVQVEKKEFGVIPYPIVSELRVGLVYRFISVTKKYDKRKHK